MFPFAFHKDGLNSKLVRQLSVQPQPLILLETRVVVGVRFHGKTLLLQHCKVACDRRITFARCPRGKIFIING